MALQWAVALARGGQPVQVVCPREPSRWVTARFLANLSRLPVSDLINRSLRGELHERYARGRAALAELPIAVFPAPGKAFTPETDPHEGAPTAVVLDDADLISGLTPAMAAGYAASGMVVILTLPRDQVLLGAGDEAPLEPTWARVCDVIVEVRRRGLLPIGVGAHESAHRPWAASRPGEADLVLHRHRWGPARTLTAGFQGHYARFVDLQR